MFYTFRQLNSGGFYKKPARHVIIEADSDVEANILAEDNGLYFHGSSTNIDCNCCGARWWMADEDDGQEEPLIYGRSPQDHIQDLRQFQTNMTEVLVIYEDGRRVCHVAQYNVDMGD